MKRTIFILFFLEYVICGSLDPDLARAPLETLIKVAEKLKDSGKYSSPSLELQAIPQDEVTLNVYTKADTNGADIPLTAASTITEVSPFNTSLKTVFYIHGWGDTVEDEGSTIVREALLEAANVNVIIVNWDKCAKSFDYFVSLRCVPDVGKYIGQFLETVVLTYSYSLSDVTVVGHSLGAHIGGHIGKHTNGTLGIIIGLDPAGPFFFKDDPSARLTEDDAQYVQAIHTEALFLGVKYNIGHADFWPNGGYLQNGCGLNGECSHQNAYRYYAESVTNNAFFARQCDSYDNFEKSNCQQNLKSMMGGVDVNTSAFGSYYLNTKAKSPFGMGDVS